MSERTPRKLSSLLTTMKATNGTSRHLLPSVRPSIDFAACELCNLTSAHRFGAMGHDEHVVILQCKQSGPELEPLVGILEQSNKEIIDFWDSTFLSPIFFVNTQVHNPLSTPEGLHNAMIATMTRFLASSAHLPVPSTTIDRINIVAIQRKLPTKLKPSPVNLP
jgi:hypothetical protein